MISNILASTNEKWIPPSFQNSDKFVPRLQAEDEPCLPLKKKKKKRQVRMRAEDLASFFDSLYRTSMAEKWQRQDAHVIDGNRSAQKSRQQGGHVSLKAKDHLVLLCAISCHFILHVGSYPPASSSISSLPSMYTCSILYPVPINFGITATPGQRRLSTCMQ